MIEPQIVETAAMYPMHCAGCTNVYGPFVDFERETHAGRIYLCRKCARTAARLFGFSKGRKLEELSNAAESLESAQALIADLEHQVEILYPIEGAKDAVIKDLEEQIQALESQMNALKGHIAEEAELNLQLARG